MSSINSANRDSVMREELAQLLDTPAFRRAPVLTRLLNFLVEETLAGRGNSLKAYTVAVDGLGRDSSFDAQTDSYPRVQIGRLRKLLAAHYAVHGPVGEFCLSIEPGSYRVRLARPTNAGGLRTKHGSATWQTLEPMAASAVQYSAAATVTAPSRHKWRLYGLTAALISAIFALFVGFWRYDQPDAPPGAAFRAPISSPVLRIEPIEVLSGSVSQRQNADLAHNILADGLGRSWVTQVRVGASGSTGRPTGVKGDSFILSTQLMASGARADRLFMRLSDERTDTLIWSSQIELPSDPLLMADHLAPIIAQLTGSFGVIATTELAANPETFSAGYGCMLQYTLYEKTRDKERLGKILACSQKSPSEFRLRSPILTAQAFLALDPNNKVADRASALKRASAFANAAVRNDPADALAQFGVARVSFVGGDCAAGNRHTELAIAANPNDPVLVAVLGGLLYQCGELAAVPILERAYMIRQTGVSYGRLPLILAMIKLGRMDRVAVLAEDGERNRGLDRGYFFLCEALIDTAMQRPEQARADWREFLTATRNEGKSVDTALQSFIATKRLRDDAVRLLRSSRITDGA